MRRIFFQIVVVFFSGVLVWAGPPEDSVALKYRFDADRPLKYAIEGSSLNTTELQGFPRMETQTFLEAVFSARLDTARSNDHFHVSMAYEKLDVTVVEGGRRSYPGMDEVVGRSVTAVVGEKGRVAEVIGLDVFPRVQVYAANPAGENFAEVLKEFFEELPEHPVGVGEEWEITTADTTEDMGRTTVVRVEGAYKLKKIGTKEGFRCAQVEGKLNIRVEQSGLTEGGEFSFEGDGKGKVQYWFVVDEGMMVEAKTSASLDGALEASGSQALTGRVSETSTSSFKLVK